MRFSGLLQVRERIAMAYNSKPDATWLIHLEFNVVASDPVNHAHAAGMIDVLGVASRARGVANHAIIDAYCFGCSAIRSSTTS